MLPVTHSETAQETAQRQANFVVLRSLETKLPQPLFEQVLSTVSNGMDLPKRVDWTGNLRPLSYSELKVNFAHIDQNFLPQMLEQIGGSNLQISKLNLKEESAKQSRQNAQLVSGRHQNMLVVARQLRNDNIVVDQKKMMMYHQISKFERMKTVFGHALIEEGYNAPIYNMLFDQTGEFVISGADDGIIKIWDKDTLTLQASLHSHEDVITDMGISKCNTFLATASKDGKVIIWDWKKCTKVEEIMAHHGSVNNIKFFTIKARSSKDSRKEENLHVLASCSEDGTIRIFDFTQASQTLNVQASAHPQERKSARNSKPENQPKKERYSTTLAPEEYRPGQRNKKIDSIHISQSGLLAAGSDKGEIFLWEIDVNAFKRQQVKAANWLGTAKKHQKAVHFCEFSPNGKYLFTGSIDGTAKIWNIEKEKQKKPDGQQRTIALTDEKLVVTLEEKRNNWQCDSITWSVNGRYAIAAISGQVDKDNNKEQTVIKIYDTHTDTIISDITKSNNIQLLNYSFVLAPHPKIEEVFMSGSDGGIICLWNIKTRRLIKKFLEYGVYSFEKYTMNDPFDGKFSPDGSCFVVGSVMGTISLFSCEGAPYKYGATRVEQFFPNDDTKHSTNIYYDGQGGEAESPQVCSYNLIPYEIQPPGTRIGKFKDSKKMTHEEYERNLMLRRELCYEEEKFIQEQLEDGLRNDMFNQENQNDLAFIQPENDEEEDLGVVRRARSLGRDRLNSQISNISPIPSNNLQGSQDDQEILNNLNNARSRGRGRATGRRLQSNNRNSNNNQRANLIMNPNFDPDNSQYDRESDENFNIQEEDEDMPEESESSSSEEEESYSFHNHRSDDTRRRNGRIQRQDRSQPRREESKANSRLLRAQRREQQRNEVEEDKIDTRSRRKRHVIDDESSSLDLDMEDVKSKVFSGEDRSSRRRLQRNNNRNMRDLPSSDDVSVNSDEVASDDDLDAYGSKTRRKTRNTSRQPERTRAAVKSTRTRGKRVQYAGMDESSSDDYGISLSENEEEKVPSKSHEQIQTSSRRKRVVIDESSSEDVEMEDPDIELPDEKTKKTKGDEDFELQIGSIALEEDMIDQKCALCYRQDPPLIGPFIRVKNKQPSDIPLFFHQECIEVNNYSFYNKQKNKWMGIGKALERNQTAPQMCARCNMIGASIKCVDCHKYYHGFLCSNLYMLFLSADRYQCFECRNLTNHKTLDDRNLKIDKSEIKAMRKQMQRDHLLSQKQSSVQYQPQINDYVYYFFQGHEKFISFYNCYFYFGEDEQLNFDYPWRRYADLEERPTLCRVKSIKYSFPSNRVLYLIKMYGRIQQIPWIPQIITTLELEIVGSNDSQSFTVDFFPSPLSEFIVLKDTYDNSLAEFERLSQQNALKNHTFTIKGKPNEKIRIVDIMQREPTTYPKSNWELIHYRKDESNRRHTRRRGMDTSDSEEPIELANIWQINYHPEIHIDQEQQLITAFSTDEKSTIINVINDILERKAEQAAPFLERVYDSVAPDYRQHVQAEMYLNLVTARILNDYYRTIEQLFFDLDLISNNCNIYNGYEHDLSKMGRKLCEMIKSEVKKVLNYQQDDGLRRQTRLQEESKERSYSKPIGKLTAPSRFDRNMPSSMDMFKKQQDDENGQKLRKKQEIPNQIEQIPAATVNQSGTLIQIKRNNVPQPTQQLLAPMTNGKESRLKQYNESLHNNHELNVMLDMSDSSDFKITPKTNGMNGSIMIPDRSAGSMNSMSMIPDRRTRGSRVNYNENQIEQQVYGTSEKTSHPKVNEQEQADELMPSLGKRTRSGRQTKVMKSSLNETLDDEKFDQLLADEGGYFGSKKRIRQ